MTDKLGGKQTSEIAPTQVGSTANQRIDLSSCDLHCPYGGLRVICLEREHVDGQDAMGAGAWSSVLVVGPVSFDTCRSAGGRGDVPVFFTDRCGYGASICPERIWKPIECLARDSCVLPIATGVLRGTDRSGAYGIRQQRKDRV